ncbi:hypothetical protein KP509_33G011000 [Ceratopteris richardii]|uniref:Auxin-responsive protein n=1 Tax=Ceratopteris richardii TaxID=49495 RepID=A0A8T2QNJ0_CERRI|nr:hypothetical protein KP509_33G011000 [Ceratopteris richardii]
MVSVDPRAKGTGLSSLNGGSDVSNPLQGRNAKTSFFVKAKLDGVRICRKVDLSAYSSYDELKVALEDLFQVFVSDNTKLDLVNGSSYVLTHEDKDGDCLLVGDVPWHMFLESAVKSLRIMRSMDSTGKVRTDLRR